MAEKKKIRIKTINKINNKANAKAIIFVLFVFFLIFYFWGIHQIKANPGTVQFTNDVILGLTGLDTTTYVVNGSQCSSLTISGTDLTVNGILSAEDFALKTAVNQILKLTPSGGPDTLTFSSSYVSSGYVSQWTENSADSIAHICGVPQSNTDYAVWVGGNEISGSPFNSGALSELSFNRTGGGVNETFNVYRRYEVTTNDATYGLITATLNGNLDYMGGESNVKVWFEWGETDAYGSFTAEQTKNSTGAFTADLSGLQAGHTYHFRAKASKTNDTGVVSGSDSNFTAGTISVTTNEATAVGDTTATLNGNLNSLGGGSEVKVWFEWGTSESYGNETVKATKDSTGAFTADLTDLTSEQAYHFRAKASATNDTGVVSGEDSTFAPAVGFSGDHKWAWGENIGWNNFQPTYGGVQVSTDGLTGYLWAENVGWIKMDYDGIPGAENTSETDWGVNNAGGNLSGYAWGENIGWVNFDSTDSGVTIDSSGNFIGYAWGENVGWIHFDHDQTDYTPKTTWTASVALPDAPTSLLCNGETNPSDVNSANQAPEFSAIHTQGIANKYRVQVDDDSGFASPIWDSGASGTSMADCSSGNRCANIVYNGDDLSFGTTYYWRIKFWNDIGEGYWSTEEAYFGGGSPNFSGDHKWAWGENTGWKNFQPTHGGVIVSDYGLTGYLWSENVGWIQMDYDGIPGADNTTSTNWGVNNDGAGVLSGYAWGENIGWVNFDSADSGVTIDSSGNLVGYAWAENVGWIHFDHDQTDYTPQTTWTATVPLITSISDSPDPQIGGSAITFTASGISDPQSDNVYLYVCSSRSYTKCSPNNSANLLISSVAGPFSSPYSGVTAAKSCTSCVYDAGNYWVRLCDANDDCSRMIPAGGGAYNCKMENDCACEGSAPSDQCYGGWCCQDLCKSVCAYADVGYLISSTFDTQITGGVAYNSMMWTGTQPSGTSVKFQLATSESPEGPWNFYGQTGDTCYTNEYYSADEGVPVEIKCRSIHNNKRYFRYKVLLYSDEATHLLTPTVTKVIVNYSP